MNNSVTFVLCMTTMKLMKRSLIWVGASACHFTLLYLSCNAGTGRYSKCFKAVNKRIRRRALGDEECSDDDSSRVSCSDNDSRSCGLDLDDDDDAQRDVRRIDAVKEALKGAFRKNKKKGRKKKKKKRKNKPSVKLEYEDEGPDAGFAFA